MRTILWIQNESPEKKNTFFIDGEKSDYSGTQEQDNAFSFLVQGRYEEDPGHLKIIGLMMQKKHRWIAICPNIQELKNLYKERVGYILANNLQCYQDEKRHFLIQSCHKELDVAGRRMPFMFYAATNNFEEACNLLKECSNALGRNCVEEELTLLKTILLKDKKKRNTRLVCCIVMIIFLIWIIVIVS